MTSADLASAPNVPVASRGPSWAARWCRAFVRLLPLAVVYMLFVAAKNQATHLVLTSTGLRIFLQSWVGELIGGMFLVAFVAAVDLLPLTGRKRVLADVAAILLTQLVGGAVTIAVLDALGAWNGRFSYGQLIWGNFGQSAVESAFALVLYRLWQRQRRRAEALRDMQRAHVELLRQTAQADLVAMRARVDPAFLFDTLGDVENAYDRDPVRGRRLVDALIAYLRAVLPGVDSEASTLGKECDVARTYVDVSRARSVFDGDIAIGVSASLGGAALPPMVIAPLIEDVVRAMPRESAPIRIDAHETPTALAVALDVDRAHSPSPAVVDQVRQRLHDLTTGGAVTITLEARKTHILLEIPHAPTPSPDR